jgi:phage terminase small subunit
MRKVDPVKLNQFNTTVDKLEAGYRRRIEEMEKETGVEIPPAKVTAAQRYEQTLANLQTYRDARARVGNMVALGSTGQLTEHPLVGTERASTAIVISIASRFGLTPADRAALGLQLLEGRTMQRDLDDVIGAHARRPT